MPTESARPSEGTASQVSAATESPHYKVCSCCKEPVTVPLEGQHNPYCSQCRLWEERLTDAK